MFINRLFAGAFACAYAPPSLCTIDDGGEADLGGGGHDFSALVESVLAKAEAAPADAGDGAGEDAQQDLAGSDAGDDGAPDEDQPSADDTGAEPEPAAEPLIEPPLSWTKEQREHWASLPRETQQYLHSREQQRDAEVRRSQNEAAEARRTNDAEKAALAQERQRYADQLNQFIALTEQLDPVLAEGQRTDWAKLANEDPAGYVAKRAQYEARQGQLAAAIQQRTALQQQHEAQQQQQMREHLAQEGLKLIEAVPEWADPDQAKAIEKAKAGIDALRKIAVERYGFAPEDVAIIRDHRIALVLKDAAALHALQAERAKEQAERAKAAKDAEAKRQSSAPRLAASPGQGQSNTGNTSSRSSNAALRKIGRDTSRPLEDRIESWLARI